MDRRDFLRTSLVGAGVAAGLGTVGLAQDARAQGADAGATTDRPKAELKLCAQHWLVPGKSLAEKAEKILKWGGKGIELGPGDILDTKKRDEVKALLAGSPIKVAAICAADGPYIVPDEAERQKHIDNAKRILDAAGEVGSTGVIMVPAFNGAKGQLEGWAARDLLIKVLKDLGEHAVKANCRMLMEPLNRGEAHFLRQVGDGASICRDVNSPGICMMGDFFHMRIEENSDMGAFISAGKLLHHVHLASWDRNLPGQDKRSFVDGFRGLKWIGYQDFCSLECGCKGDRETETPKAFDFLKKQWEEAVL